jgi:fimbrial chaperone protein
VTVTSNTRTKIASRRGTAAGIGLAGLFLFLANGTVRAQSLAVLPVSLQMAPGQMAAALTLINQAATETSVQIRVFTWKQPDGNDQLIPSDEVMVSPPLGTIAAGATQVVRLILRKPPQGLEASYRILVDQIPAPAAPGTVRIALRLSIPIFAEPVTRIAPHLQWRIEGGRGQLYLVSVNDGSRHETVRDIVLTTSGGGLPKIEPNVSPYVLAGATRRWRIVTAGLSPAFGTAARLTARADAGAIDQSVAVGAGQ